MIGSNRFTSMSDFNRAINLICHYVGFNEKAYPDITTGCEPYSIGYGTQFYPDGSPVKNGQCCTKQRAWEYLYHELQVIDEELTELNLGLDDAMRQALISFIHSVGWETFLYNSIIDHIDNEDWEQVTKEMMRWVFDQDKQVVGTLLDRRKEEIDLFLSEMGEVIAPTPGILLSVFRSYKGTPAQQKAIEILESGINPYELSEFVNNFRQNTEEWEDYLETDSLEDAYSLRCFEAICDI